MHFFHSENSKLGDPFTPDTRNTAVIKFGHLGQHSVFFIQRILNLEIHLLQRIETLWRLNLAIWDKMLYFFYTNNSKLGDPFFLDTRNTSCPLNLAILGE